MFPLNQVMSIEFMTAFVALDCNTPVDVEVERLGAGAGKVRCFECAGSGRSSFPKDMYAGGKCPDCTGSGFVLISV